MYILGVEHLYLGLNLESSLDKICVCLLTMGNLSGIPRCFKDTSKARNRRVAKSRIVIILILILVLIAHSIQHNHCSRYYGGLVVQHLHIFTKKSQIIIN